MSGNRIARDTCEKNSDKKKYVKYKTKYLNIKANYNNSSTLNKNNMKGGHGIIFDLKLHNENQSDSIDNKKNIKIKDIIN